jgi:hypothetical protein
MVCRATHGVYFAYVTDVMGVGLALRRVSSGLVAFCGVHGVDEFLRV